MIHTVVFRVGSEEALEFWQRRLGEEGVRVERAEGRVRFQDPDGLQLALSAEATDDEPLVAEHPDIPAELALHGFAEVRAFAVDPQASRPLLEETLGFEPDGSAAVWEVRGASRGGTYAYDAAPDERGLGGAGTVHHVAWSSTMDDHEAWRDAVAAAGMRPTPVIDRFWFRSIYFREPSGVLFELATLGPGFAVDEDEGQLGESLVLPPAFEHMREQVEKVVTPLPNPRPWART